MKERIIRTTCGICQIGCGVLAYVSDDRVLRIEGDPDHPLNRGKLCPKGMASLEYLYHPDRLRQPLKRIGKRGEGKCRLIFMRRYALSLSFLLLFLSCTGGLKRFEAAFHRLNPGRRT